MVYTFLWFFNVVTCEKPRLQNSQWYGFSPVWDLMCLWRQDALKNPLSQSWHQWVRSLLCCFLWRIAESLLVNSRPQSSHLCILPMPWEDRCCLRSEVVAKVFSQNWHCHGLLLLCTRSMWTLMLYPRMNFLSQWGHGLLLLWIDRQDWLEYVLWQCSHSYLLFTPTIALILSCWACSFIELDIRVSSSISFVEMSGSHSGGSSLGSSFVSALALQSSLISNDLATSRNSTILSL